jgi:TupA-like ATPgrasp
MPLPFSDRDVFVRCIQRRREAARWAYHARRRIGLAPQSSQAEIYDGTFRSDAEAVSYFYAVRNDHLPDLDRPTWINEKVRWQFVNHPNPLMRLAADKLAVRDYLRLKGAALPPAEIVASGSSPQDLRQASLPQRFVLKATWASGYNHFEDGVSPTPRATLAAKFGRWRELDYWRHAAELHYRGLPKRWLAEEMLGPREAIVEYKFYCIHGEPVFVLVISDRAGPRYNCALFDLDWKPVDFHWRGYPATATATPRPARLGTLIEEARRLSEDFLHVRVDFIQAGGRLLFSELTFSGGAARNPFVPLVNNVEIGARLDLGRAPEYLARGERIAAELRGSLPEPRTALPRRPWRLRRPALGYPAPGA